MKTTTISGKARFCAPALFKHDVTIEGTLRYRHLKGMDCGLFSDYESLCQAYPDPRPGMYALLINPDSTTTFLLYACQRRGEWALLSDEARLDMLDVSQYDHIHEIAESLADAGRSLSGFAVLTDIAQLPYRPLVRSMGYLVDGHLYVYVESGGDTADGRYQNCGPLRGATGATGPKGNDGVILDPLATTIFQSPDDLDGKTATQKETMIPSANAANEMVSRLEENRLSGNIIPMKTIDGVYIDSSGEEAASVSYATHVYLVRRGFSFIHVSAKIGPSAYVTVCAKDGTVIARYKGTTGSPYSFDKDVYLDEGAFYVKIPAMVSGTLTVTDAMPGDHADFAYAGEIADLLGTEIPLRQGYLKNDGSWQKALNYFHYIVPVSGKVSSLIVKTNTQAFAYQFFSAYRSAAPYADVSSGTVPVYACAENCKEGYMELAAGAEHVISVPRDAKFLYISGTVDRKPLSLRLSGEHLAERVSGYRLAPLSVDAGKYIDTTETEQTSSSTALYTYDVSGRKYIYVKTRLASLGMSLFKDSNEATVARFLPQWKGRSGINTDAVYRVPSDAASLILSVATGYELVVSDVSVAEADNCANMFATKKVAFLGDSITAGVGASDNNHRYSSVFTSLARCFEVNLGVNGTCLAANTKNGKSAERFITRATQENIGDADVIFVFGGTNDFTYDNKAIGDLFVETAISGTTYRGIKKKTAPPDNETFAGALHELILHIRSVNPTARLIFIAPMTRGVWHKQVTPPSSAETNANGDYLQDYGHAISEICAFYSVPVVDMTTLINQYWGNDNEDDNILQPLDDDGIHPNDAGHERIARILYNYCIHNMWI